MGNSLLPRPTSSEPAAPLTNLTRSPIRQRRARARCAWLLTAASLSLLAALPTPAQGGAAKDCIAVPLSEPLAWPSSGAWYQAPGGPGLLIADVARDPHHLFTVDLTGSVSLAPLPDRGQFGFAAFVRPGDDEILVEDKAGKLLALSPDLSRQRVAIDLRQVRVTGGGKLADVLDWTWSNGKLLTVAYLDGNSAPGYYLTEIDQAGLARPVEPLAPSDLAKTWYAQTAGNLAGLGGDGYFLDLAAGPSLKRLAAGANNAVGLTATAPAFAGGPRLDRSRLWQEEQALKMVLPGSSKRQAFLYFDLLERSAVVAGLLRAGTGDLFLLTKQTMNAAGETLWTLVELSPTTGKEVRRVVLPTAAAHLTVIPPGPEGAQWAILERARVGRRAADGAPTFSSSRLLLLSADAIAHPPVAWQRALQPPRCEG